MQISVDGLVSTGPDDDQSWVTWAWDDIKQYVLELIDTTDTIVIGRKLAVDYIPYWLNIATIPDDPMYELAQRIVRAKKIVFSKSISTPEWENTELAKGDIVQEINTLKNQEGKDIIVYGSSSFVSSLINESLIDEFHLFVNPVAIGNGVPIFDKLAHYRKMKLNKSVTFNTGIILLNYVLTGR
jgi:dihydrofolate reductase